MGPGKTGEWDLLGMALERGTSRYGLVELVVKAVREQRQQGWGARTYREHSWWGWGAEAGKEQGLLELRSRTLVVGTRVVTVQDQARLGIRDGRAGEQSWWG